MSNTFYFAEANNINLDDNTETIISKAGGGKIFSLTSTGSIKISEPAKITSSPVEDGDSIVDNYYLDNREATFSGVVSSISIGSEQIEPETWLSEVRALRQSKELLVVVADTEVLSFSLISNVDLSKTKQQGSSGWKCDISFKEVDISERARVVDIKVPKPEKKDEVAVKEKTAGVPTKWKEVNASTATEISRSVLGSTDTVVTP